MRCCWRSVSCLADLVHVHCNIRLMCISPISLCSRDSREICSQECIIYSLYPQCLWHSIQTLLPSTKQGHEKTLVISAYSWRFRKISCNQSRACRRPNNTWTELFSTADSKGSTRQGKAEIMCTEKRTWRDCAVKSTIKHLYITEKWAKCSWHQTCSYWTEITQNLHTVWSLSKSAKYWLLLSTLNKA